MLAVPAKLATSPGSSRLVNRCASRLLFACSIAVLVAGRTQAGEAAEASAARISARVDAAIRAYELEAARAAAIATPRPGMLATRRALVFMDGPEIPWEWVEWSEGAGVRRARRPIETDTVLRVRPGSTLSLSNFAGDISVEVWNRNEVRVRAEHDRGDRIVAKRENATLRLRALSPHPDPAEVEWTLTVPRWLPLELSGMEGDIKVAGLRSSVRVQSVRGDVSVSGCEGPLEANSVEGEVHVTDVDGNVSAGSVNNVIRILRVTGPVEAQTINGDIQLEKLTSPNVDASSLNGRVYFASSYQPRGHYTFASHNGHVYVGLPTDQNVNVTVSSFNGEFESSVPMPAPTPAARARLKGRPMRFTLGEVPSLVSGTRAPNAPRAPRSPRSPRTPVAPAAPELELESFGGLIQLASQEEVLREIDRQRMRLDSMRSTLLRARREATRARRAAEQARPTPAPEAPEAPNHR